MTTLHDDRPHPVPPCAALRWKENYFFIVMDREHAVYGVAHVNNEPLFNRSRFTLNLQIEGQSFRYASEVPLPAPFEGARELTDGQLAVRFLEPHRRIELALASEDLTASLLFEARFPTFDFAVCRSAAPELPSFQEVMTLGLNLPYNHQQQSMTVRGHLVSRTAGATRDVTVEGLGYRDHSWSMRSDKIVRRHVWSGLNFPDRTLGIKMIETLHRPGLWAKEGYVSDSEGERALRSIEITHADSTNGWPGTTVFAVQDADGRRFTIRADVARRLADVPLHAEKSTAGTPSYEILETFPPLTLLESGQQGIGLVEIGRHPTVRDAY